MTPTPHKIPGYFRHYKGGVYFASHLVLGEADGLLYVVYAPLNHFADPAFDNHQTQASRDHLYRTGASAYMRPLDVFSEHNEHGFSRFTRITRKEASGWQ